MPATLPAYATRFPEPEPVEVGEVDAVDVARLGNELVPPADVRDVPEYVFRQAEIDAILVDTAELMSADEGGDIVVVSGAPQSGRSTVLRHVAAGLAAQGWTVVHRTAVDGALQPVPHDTVRRWGWAVQGLKVAGAATNLVAPVAGGIMALAGEIATAVHMRAAEAEPEARDDPYLAMTALADVLERAAATTPVALVVDDADQLVPPQPWWDGLFGVTLPRLMENLPIVAVVVVDGSASAGGAHAWSVLSDRLLADGIATEIVIAPLTAGDVERALGEVDDELVTELVRFGRSRPGWVDEVFRRWQESGIAVHDGGWRFADGGRARARATQRNWVDGLLHDALPDGDDRARQILRVASLEGPTFTAEAVAEVLGRDADELVATIDRTLADADPPLVVADEDAEGLHRYRIVSPLLAGTLRETTLSGTDGPVLAGRYAHALFRLYRDRPRSPSAWTISRLAAHAKDEQITEAVWRRAGEHESLADLARRARVFADRLDGDIDDTERLWATRELNALVRPLALHGWWVEDTLHLARRAERSARDLADAADVGSRRERLDMLVGALERVGVMHSRAAELSRALDDLEEAAALSAATADHERTARLLGLVARGGISLLTSEGDERAARAVAAAVDAARAVTGDVRASIVLAGALATATFVHVSRNDPAAALAAVADAANEMSGREVRDDSQYADTCSNVVAAASYVASRIGDDRSVELDERRIACEFSDVQRAVGLHNLALALDRAGRWPEAVVSLCQSLRLAQTMNVIRNEAGTLVELARIAHMAGSPAGQAFLVCAIDLWDDVVRHAHTGSRPVLEAQLSALEGIDADQREALRQSYRTDGGRALLRDTFGVDVDDIDLRNTRLRRPDRDDLVAHVTAVAAWAGSRLREGEAPQTGGDGSDDPAPGVTTPSAAS